MIRLMRHGTLARNRWRDWIMGHGSTVRTVTPKLGVHTGPARQDTLSKVCYAFTTPTDQHKGSPIMTNDTTVTTWHTFDPTHSVQHASLDAAIAYAKTKINIRIGIKVHSTHLFTVLDRDGNVISRIHV